MRAFMCLLMCGLLGAAERYAFTVDEVRWYRYTLDHVVGWSSAGDELTYTQRLAWTFALRVTASSETSATVNATIIRVEADSRGPGFERRLDSRESAATTEADPLLGHLAALAGTTVTLTIAPETGVVTAVAGGSTLIAALAARQPPAAPGRPMPLAEDLARLYSDEALARWWTALLVLPGQPTPVPLASEPPIALARTWEGARFTLALPAGTDQTAAPRVVLAREPTPVAGTLSAVTGSGEVALADGMPGRHTGELTYTLTLDALTQAVEQRHTLRWTLVTLERAE